MSVYKRAIQNRLIARDRTDLDPRHIEAFMLLQYGTLDHLSSKIFTDEVRLFIDEWEHSQDDEWERCAVSYGL